MLIAELIVVILVAGAIASALCWVTFVGAVRISRQCPRGRLGSALGDRGSPQPLLTAHRVPRLPVERELH